MKRNCHRESLRLPRLGEDWPFDIAGQTGQKILDPAHAALSR
jgi:hypothetical protein